MKVLLAVDGSEYSQMAVDFLSTFPLGSPLELLVATVCPVDLPEGPREDFPEEYLAYAEECHAEGEALLEKITDQCRDRFPSVETRLLAGSPSRSLVKLAKDEKCDVIVLGARGRGAVNRFFLGSVSGSVAKHAECSVLVVRPRPQEQQGLKILIATDEMLPSAQAVSRFAEFPLGETSQVKLVSVVNVLQAFHLEQTLQQGPVLTTLLARNRDRLQVAAERLKKATPHVETHLIEINSRMSQGDANVAECILREADYWHPDLIVVGSTGQSTWERVLLGSVSTRILNHAPCSVWIDRSTPSPAKG